MVMCVCLYRLLCKTDRFTDGGLSLIFLVCPSWCRGSGRCLNENDCCQVYDRNLACASNCSNNDDLVDSNYVCRK